MERKALTDAHGDGRDRHVSDRECGRGHGHGREHECGREYVPWLPASFTCNFPMHAESLL